MSNFDPNDFDQDNMFVRQNEYRIISTRLQMSLHNQSALTALPTAKIRHYTDTDVELICRITTQLSPWMEMSDAMNLVASDMGGRYVEDTELRARIDL